MLRCVIAETSTPRILRLALPGRRNDCSVSCLLRPVHLGTGPRWLRLNLPAAGRPYRSWVNQGAANGKGTSAAMTEPSRDDIPDLLPARMLNEFTYCPRLFYLEWVQREFAPSEDTVAGSAVHERADRPRGELREESGITATSVALSSERLGLTAVIDVAEGTGRSVRPVDYKKGSAPGIPGGAWEPDMVQVCVQALLLRDAGYDCDEAVLYYAGSRTRVTVPVTDELAAKTLDLARQARELAASGRIPLPLVDSPKCH